MRSRPSLRICLSLIGRPCAAADRIYYLFTPTIVTSLALGWPVKPDKAEATSEYGLLRVEVPFKDPMEDTVKVVIKAGGADTKARKNRWLMPRKITAEPAGFPARSPRDGCTSSREAGIVERGGYPDRDLRETADRPPQDKNCLNCLFPDLNVGLYTKLPQIRRSAWSSELIKSSARLKMRRYRSSPYSSARNTPCLSLMDPAEAAAPPC
jgi:hypothetical protein